jgi:excisionase family DNA binding protein
MSGDKCHDWHDDLIDAREASRLTGLKVRTFYRLASQGRIPAFRVLRHSLRFKRRDVLALVKPHVVQPAENWDRL